MRRGQAGIPSRQPGSPRASDRQRSVERLVGAQRWRWWAVAGSWLAVALSVALGLHVNFEAQGLDVPLAWSLMSTLPHYAVWALLSPALYRALHEVLSAPRPSRWHAILAGWCLAALTGSMAMSWLSYALRRGLPLDPGLLIEVYFLPPAGPAFQAMNFSILVLALAAFAAVRGWRMRDRAAQSASRAELRGARLEAQLADARLQALQARINPHFLLNSLNAIDALVRTGERDRAHDAISSIGELLQIAIRNSRRADVTLGEEVDFLERYLALQRIRLDGRLHFRLGVPEALRSVRLPALAVQPLIENSIKHGLEPEGSLRLELRAERSGDRIEITVEDDGRGLDAARDAPAGTGEGIANVAERLRLYFGGTATLRLAPRSPRGTRATISCPA